MEVNSATLYVTSESTAIFDYFGRLISKIGVKLAHVKSNV